MTSKVRFVTIGYIEWRKGQNLLIDVVQQLPAEIAAVSEFLLIGQNTSLMAQELAGKIEAVENVRMLGTLSRTEVHDVFDSTDVLICPSREDPMPTVCAEAMMHSVPCLVSDATGTAAYIKDGYDGLLFESGDIEDLRDKIIWCVGHRDELKKMGGRAHRIYENVFSEEAFEESLLKHVEAMIGKARS